MRIWNYFLALGIAFIALSFTNNKTADYTVNTGKSELTWKAAKVTGEHYGTINIVEGELITADGKVSGGNFAIDMNSITVTDLTDPTYNQKLVNHLKSDDFFSSAKFPESTLVINEVTARGGDKYELEGELTIKGITHPIEFPATIKTSGNSITAQAKIIVDRSKYDVRYGSNSFFDNLGDKAIYDEFELNVNLIADKNDI